MTDELERRREECLQLRAMMADRMISMHSIAKESYGGQDDIVNEDNELEMAYKTQKDLNRLVHFFFSFFFSLCQEMPSSGGRDTMQVQVQLVVKKECLFLFSFLGRSHQVNIILLSEYNDVGYFQSPFRNL